MAGTKYEFDERTLTYVEVRESRLGPVVWTTAAVLAVGLGVAFAMDWASTSPQEVALRIENRALQDQLVATSERLTGFSTQLDDLGSTDRELYRLILQAEDISEDVRQVGVGGTDPYRAFDRFSSSSAELLRSVASGLDQIERRIVLQSASYSELNDLALERKDALRELPTIAPTTGRLSSFFGMRNHPILRIRRHHGGVDFSVPRGSPVYATGDGIVEEIGNEPSGYGRFIIIDHPNAGYKTLYAHLQSTLPGMRSGKRVSRGEQIALSGNTGLSSAPHVHYEVRDQRNVQINPIRFLVNMTPSEHKALVELAEASKHVSSLD